MRQNENRQLFTIRLPRTALHQIEQSLFKVVSQGLKIAYLRLFEKRIADIDRIHPGIQALLRLCKNPVAETVRRKIDPGDDVPVSKITSDLRITANVFIHAMNDQDTRFGRAAFLRQLDLQMPAAFLAEVQNNLFAPQRIGFSDASRL